MSIYTLCNSYDVVLFWLINIQLHLRVAYKMVWLSHGNEDEWTGLYVPVLKETLITKFSIFNKVLVRCNVLLIPKFNSPIFLFT